MCPVLDHDDSGLDTCKDECNPQHLGDRSDCAKDHYCCRYNFLILGKYSVFCFQVFSTKDFSIIITLHSFFILGPFAEATNAWSQHLKAISLKNVKWQTNSCNVSTRKLTLTFAQINLSGWKNNFINCDKNSFIRSIIHYI